MKSLLQTPRLLCHFKVEKGAWQEGPSTVPHTSFKPHGTFKGSFLTARNYQQALVVEYYKGDYIPGLQSNTVVHCIPGIATVVI